MGSKRQAGPFTAAAVTGVTVALLMACAFDFQIVRGETMEPQLHDGSRVLVNRLAYVFKEPEKGQVVAFTCNVYSEDGEGSTLYRRVAATEGDTVEIKDGNLFVNGSLYGNGGGSRVYLESMDKTVIGRNRVFVLSDTGTAVLDSRDQAVGQLKICELQGRVCFK